MPKSKKKKTCREEEEVDQFAELKAVAQQAVNAAQQAAAAAQQAAASVAAMEKQPSMDQQPSAVGQHYNMEQLARTQQEAAASIQEAAREYRVNRTPPSPVRRREPTDPNPCWSSDLCTSMDCRYVHPYQRCPWYPPRKSGNSRRRPTLLNSLLNELNRK